MSVNEKLLITYDSTMIFQSKVRGKNRLKNTDVHQGKHCKMKESLSLERNMEQYTMKMRHYYHCLDLGSYWYCFCPMCSKFCYVCLCFYPCTCTFPTFLSLLYNIFLFFLLTVTPPQATGEHMKDWVFINYTFKRFEGLTQRGMGQRQSTSLIRWRRVTRTRTSPSIPSARLSRCS